MLLIPPTATLLHKPKTPGLRFNTHKDALDFSAKSVEDSNNWLAVNNLDFVKRNKNAEIEIVLEFCFGAEGDKYHLVFCSVPNMGIGHVEETSTANLSPNANESGANRNDHFMLVSIAYLPTGGHPLPCKARTRKRETGFARVYPWTSPENLPSERHYQRRGRQCFWGCCGQRQQLPRTRHCREHSEGCTPSPRDL